MKVGQASTIRVVWNDVMSDEEESTVEYPVDRWVIEDRTLAMMIGKEMIVVPYESMKCYTVTPSKNPED